MQSSIARLVSARLIVQNDELLGEIVFDDGDSHTRYYQLVPTAHVTGPLGWESIARATCTRVEDVVAGWSDEGDRNPAAEDVFARLHARAGSQFLFTPADGVAAPHFSLLEVEDPSVAPRIALDTPNVPAAVTYMPFESITPVIDSQNINPPYLALTATGAPPVIIPIPDADHVRDPAAWFFVEAITEVPAKLVANGWMTNGPRLNPYLNQAVSKLVATLSGQQAPIAADGTIDLRLTRRAIIQARYRADGTLPTLFVGRNHGVMVERCWEFLKDTIGHDLFRYEAAAGATAGCLSVIVNIDGRRKLQVLDDEDILRGVVGRTINFASPTRRSVSVVQPPNLIIKDMRKIADQAIRPVDALVRIPTMRADGTVNDVEGYDARSRTWYAPELTLAPIAVSPTAADIEDARSTIVGPFAEFPFVQSSGALPATIACLMEQIVRPMIHGPRPIFAFDAPDFAGAGTGKSRLACALGAVITGQESAITPWPEDPKELSKTITSKLHAGDPFVIFDNLEGVVRHKDLAALATSGTWSTRLLHTNDSPSLRQTATWCITLNGARFNPDIARRTVLIRLDTKRPNPHQRVGFKISDLVGWCMQNRAKMIRSVLVLARAWVAAGRPPADPVVTMGSFEGWTSVLGGILHFAQLDGLAQAVAQTRARDITTLEHETFVGTHWASTFGGSLVTALQLAELAERVGAYVERLERVRAPTWRGRYMSDIVRPLAGHVFHGWRVMVHPALINGSRAFFLSKVEMSTAH